METIVTSQNTQKKPITAGQIKQFNSMLRHPLLELSSEEAQQILNSSHTKGIVDFLSLLASVNIQELNLAVDYNDSLKTMVRKGNYSEVHKGLKKENFPYRMPKEWRIHKKIHKLKIELLNFGDMKVKTQEIFKVMSYLGYRPATLPELLAIGVQYPDLQLQFPIAAFGSLYERQWYAPSCAYLREWLGRRTLDIWHIFNKRWSAKYRFAMVKD